MSPLSGQLETYLAMRRALGYQLHEHERLLAELLVAVERRGESRITVDAVLDWATGGGKVSRGQAARRLSVARRFATYLAAFDRDGVRLWDAPFAVTPGSFLPDIQLNAAAVGQLDGRGGLELVTVTNNGNSPGRPSTVRILQLPASPVAPAWPRPPGIPNRSRRLQI